MRVRGVTYRELGQRIGLSEPTIKRIFSKKKMTLSRLETICNVLGISVGELAASAVNSPDETSFYSLSQEQEAVLAENPDAWRLFVVFLAKRSLKAAARRLRLDPRARARLSLVLARLGLISLKEGEDGRAQLLVSPHIRMSRDGVLRRSLIQRTVAELAQSLPAQRSSERMMEELCGCQLSERSARDFKDRFAKLLQEVRAVSDLETRLGVAQIPLTVLLLIRKKELEDF